MANLKKAIDEISKIQIEVIKAEDEILTAQLENPDSVESEQHKEDNDNDNGGKNNDKVVMITKGDKEGDGDGDNGGDGDGDNGGDGDGGNGGDGDGDNGGEDSDKLTKILNLFLLVIIKVMNIF